MGDGSAAGWNDTREFTALRNRLHVRYADSADGWHVYNRVGSTRDKRRCDDGTALRRPGGCIGLDDDWGATVDVDNVSGAERVMDLRRDGRAAGEPSVHRRHVRGFAQRASDRSWPERCGGGDDELVRHELFVRRNRAPGRWHVHH